jgi:hypothetical protein
MFNPIQYSSNYINSVINNGFRTSKNKNFNSILIKEFCKKLKKNKQICKVADELQRKTVQLKTNYFSKSELNKQIRALKVTLENISSKLI